jgi:5-methylcytosine-specific restriction endonuclease McrA
MLRGRDNAKKARRRARKLRATPPWADNAAMARIYKKSSQLTKQNGIKYNVDHIVPLQGDDVSGLHVQTNLRIVPAHINNKKGNRFNKQTKAYVLRLMARESEKLHA